MLNYAVTMVRDNLKKVFGSIRQAEKKAGRQPGEVKLVCVTKEATIEQVKEAIACGVTDVGENRLQSALEKRSFLLSSNDYRLSTIKWHFIGHLQTNKVKRVVQIFDLIHSVDSFHLAEEISRQAAKINKAQDILLQVNTSGEESKFGLAPEDLKNIFNQIIKLRNINIVGLMTMAPFVDEAEFARPCFKKLKELFEDLNVFLGKTPLDLVRLRSPGVAPDRHDTRRMTQLSMGMTQDYGVAIEEGATIVRIGSAIFKDSV